MINRRAAIRAMKCGLLAMFLVFTVSSVSQASPLLVATDSYPNILAGSITSRYDALTGAFTASGLALTLNDGTSQTSIGKAFRLEATIDNSGVATYGSGSLTIGSSLSPLLLYSYNLTRFAFNPVQGGALEFLFGAPAGVYVPGTYSAKPVDVVLTVGNTFLGSFGSSWYSTSNTAQIRPEADPIPNPEPSTLLLMLAGAGGLYKARKRKQG